MQKMKRHLQAKEADLGTAPKKEFSGVERKQKSVTLKRKQWFQIRWGSLWKGNDEYACTPLKLRLVHHGFSHVDLAWEGGQIHFNPLQSVETDDLVILLSAW